MLIIKTPKGVFILPCCCYTNGMKNTNKGFTLAEIMVVVGLIAILMTLILVGINRNKVQTRDNVRVSDIQSIRLALEQYRASCGVFPASLDLDTNNTRTSLQQSSSNGCRFTLGDFIPEIPTAPVRSNASQVINQGIANSANVFGGDTTFGGYFYAGLSSRNNGPCFEYHIAAELEYAIDNDEEPSRYLSLDHDFAGGEGTYDRACAGSPLDFGSNNAENDDELGLYDFRSQKAGEIN